MTDAVARQLHIAQVLGGTGTIPGKFQGVVAATITRDGTLLMLENGNNRIQAFDLGSNPARCFANAPTPYFLPLTVEMPVEDNWVHLDIQADGSGLLYLMSTKTDTGVYRLSIYDRSAKSQQALSRTEGLYAARIGLDHFRNLYTLNDQPLTTYQSTTPTVITEPSVSLWIPSDV